jgi:hypothetical protein
MKHNCDTLGWRLFVQLVIDKSQFKLDSPIQHTNLAHALQAEVPLKLATLHTSKHIVSPTLSMAF